MSNIVTHQPAAVASIDADASAIEQAMVKGDLTNLTPRQRVTHYKNVCDSLKLNPFTKPFDYIVLNSKLLLYPLKSCTDQLRALHNVNLAVVSRKVADGILTVHVRATMPNGRVDEDFGTVAFPEKMAPDFRANMELKAITKAKRRVTLSICGLGWLDETELDFAGHRAGEIDPDETPGEIEYDRETGELANEQPASDRQEGSTPGETPPGEGREPTPSDPLTYSAELLAQYDAELKRAATNGSDQLGRAWKLIPPSARRWPELEPILRQHQQHARDIDDRRKRHGNA